MNVLINCSNLKVGGGIQVAHSFINYLKNNRQFKFFIVLSEQLSNQVKVSEFNENFSFINYDVNNNPIRAIVGKDKFLDSLVKNENISVVFSVFGPSYWKPLVTHIVGYAKPHYVYKDSPFFKQINLKDYFKLKVKHFFHMYDFSNNNNVIITENEDVSSRLREILKNKRIFTVTNYYNQVFDNPKLWDRSIELPLYKGFTLLTVSANYPHKNLSVIKDVIIYLNQNYPHFNFRFILTIDQNEMFDYIDENILSRIVFLGKINVNQCPFLYEQCDAVFLPTLLECFTATYPEAMRMERPILTSNLNFAKGLCENAAIYFDPLSPIDIGEKIVRLSIESSERELIVIKGKERLQEFDNYKERAKKYLEIILNEANNSIL